MYNTYNYTLFYLWVCSVSPHTTGNEYSSRCEANLNTKIYENGVRFSIVLSKKDDTILNRLKVLRYGDYKEGNIEDSTLLISGRINLTAHKNMFGFEKEEYDVSLGSSGCKSLTLSWSKHIIGINSTLVGADIGEIDNYYPYFYIWFNNIWNEWTNIWKDSTEKRYGDWKRWVHPYYVC